VAGFPVFSDNHVRQPIVDGLLRRGWKVVRSVDTFGEGEDDEPLFAHAAKEGLVFVTSDEKIHAIAMRWLAADRPFRMVFWKHAHHTRMSDGDFILAFEEISRKPNAFAYPIEYITPKG
jgi:PIN like domain